MKVNTNKLGMYTMFGGIISMVFLQESLGADLSSRVGLALFFVGFLITAFGYVMSRLKRIGAEAWALGSIIVYLGFIFFSLPILIFVMAPDAVPISYQWMMIGGSALLIFLGYGTERWELNQYFLSAYYKTVTSIKAGLALFYKRMTSSFVFLPMVVFILLLVASFFTDLEDSIAEQMGGQVTGLEIQLILIGIIFLLVIVEAREIVKSIVLFIGKGAKALSLTFFYWLKKLPEVVSKSLNYMWRGTNFIVRLLGRLLANSYLIGTSGFLYFLIQGIVSSNEENIGGAFILLGISISLLFTQQRERVQRVIGNVQERVIRRKISRAAKTGYCTNCGNQLSAKQLLLNNCSYCNASIQKCGVCYGIIDSNQNIVSCPHCKNPGHSEHIEKWTSYTGTCPYCRQEWRIISTQ